MKKPFRTFTYSSGGIVEKHIQLPRAAIGAKIRRLL
jgi:hypothetical protein